MSDLLKRSADIIDSGDTKTPRGRVNLQLSEIADGIGLIESFSNIIAFKTDDGLIVIDTTLRDLIGACLQSLRAWSSDRVHTIIYTHGHIDHIGGGQALLEEAQARGEPRPFVIGHANIKERFERYRTMSDYNNLINERQFGLAVRPRRTFLPEGTPEPDTIIGDAQDITIGGIRVTLQHAKGETDDHLWSWLPDSKAICVGDLLIPSFPNAGNPQKRQRFPLEWAKALRDMATKEAELLLPSHGLPIGGKARIAKVLDRVASALESLVEQTLKLMNEGASLNTILHTVKLDEALLKLPYLQPVYDEPEFVIRSIWRLYGGWYDGNPAHLKPAEDARLAEEWVLLAGGAKRILERALELSKSSEHRLAAHLVENAFHALPNNLEVHAVREEIYRERRKAELSLMAKGIFGAAERESHNAIDPEHPLPAVSIFEILGN